MLAFFWNRVMKWEVGTGGETGRACTWRQIRGIGLGGGREGLEWTLVREVEENGEWMDLMRRIMNGEKRMRVGMMEKKRWEKDAGTGGMKNLTLHKRDGGENPGQGLQ